MNKLIDALKRSPRRVAGLAVLVSAIAIPAGLLAWGPDRPTYTLEQPADHVTFNSITNNQKHGDERNFVQIREVGGQYGEQASIVPGKEYEAYVFYHNNYKNHNETEAERMNGPGVARNTQMRVQMPRVAKKGEKTRISAVVSASNAQPNQVWDEAYGVATSDVALRYVQGSAKITNDGATNGMTMPDSLFTTGANLGFNKLDGNLPGCNEFSGFVTFRFKAVQPNFEIQKTVARHGDNNFVENLQTKVGETVDYKIHYLNSGQVQQDNVVIQDTLPKGLEYVKGSTLVATSATNGQWKNISNDSLISEGINVGSYAPNGSAYIKFSAKVTEQADRQMVNTAFAKTDNGTKNDTAVVTVNKPKVAYECSAIAASQLSRNKFKFDVGYSAENATYKKVVYVIKDENGKVITQIDGNSKAVEYEFTKSGKYTVEAKIVFTVNGKEVVAGTEKCTANIEVKPEQPKTVDVCEVETGKIVKVTEEEVKKDSEGKYSNNKSDCEKKLVKVCKVSDKTIVTINEKDFDGNVYTKDTSDCNTTPLTPAEPTNPSSDLPISLPETGATGAISLAGIGLVTLIVGYAVSGRKIN